MADDLITLVTTDHRELQRLFDMMKTDRSSRPLALPLAVAMLEAHSEAEEDRVYPAVAREAGEKEEAEHAAEEHHQAESLGKHLLEMDWESEEFDRALEEWVGAVVHHIEEEENEILPALGEAVGPERLRELGMQFATRRSRKLAGQPLKAAGGGADAGQAEQTEGGGTRAELYEKARELDVEGRSSMNKEELAQEVNKAQDRGNG
ncbi:hemerythrin domain-containing protein [Streptomyces sp. ISL-22]|uniref:Rho termination factor N-terminal domain-containing protein n=1 Tax=unclassified Streptomyces TaxID=2593676 RepID=UPI001BEA6F7E|nr:MULTISPECIES: Rho termination factor N-terminal domain-containing protein [unclassified Streptomyces]MBT2420280.1 hemerythrin domain-containing protein [Streptomyces sp. ISL-24]MBT2433106.1 hemerythrin domain-containing protein [Streptomyces sp. ISL-22]